jgi:hypothetical protein
LSYRTWRGDICLQTTGDECWSSEESSSWHIGLTLTPPVCVCPVSSCSGHVFVTVWTLVERMCDCCISTTKKLHVYKCTVVTMHFPAKLRFLLLLLSIYCNFVYALSIF